MVVTYIWIETMKCFECFECLSVIYIVEKVDSIYIVQFSYI